MSRKGWGRRTIGVLVAIPLTLVLAGNAQAGSLFKVGEQLNWSSSGQFEAQLVDVNYWAGTLADPVHEIVVYNQTTTISSDFGCGPARTVPAGEPITCSTAGVSGWRIFPWDGADTIRTGVCRSTRFCLGLSAPTIPMTIDALGGHDVITAGSAGDTINASAGNDTINAGGGNDTINADDNDSQAGNDTINGGGGDDLINARAGNDTIDAGDGADTINGGAGDDVVTPGLGDDGDIDGGDGTDKVSYNDGRTQRVVVTLNTAGAPGDPQNDGGLDDNATPGERENLMRFEDVIGTPAGDELTGTSAANKLEGLGGADVLMGLDQGDELLGGAGDDILDGGAGADTLDGGDDADTLDYSARSEPLFINLANTARVNGGAADDNGLGDRDRVLNVENANGGSGSDTILGNGSANVIKGGAGADTMDGGPGADTISYEDHADGVNVTMQTGADDDGNATDGPEGARDDVTNFENLIGTDGDDTLYGPTASAPSSLQVNTISGRGGDDTIRGGPGQDTLRGGDGTDTVSYGDRGAGEPVNLSADNTDNDGAAGENDILGTTFEVFTGGAGDDTLSATIAGAGVDLRGAGGNDVISASNSGNRLYGEEGDDTLNGGNGADTLDGGNGSDSLAGVGGVDRYFGGEADDSIHAQDGLAEEVDCGGGANDFAQTDGNDVRSSCELPAPPAVQQQPQQQQQQQPPPATNTPQPVAQLQTPAVRASYKLLRKPAKTTTFRRLQLGSVPAGSKVVGRCLTKKGKTCKGKLKKSFSKNNARGTVRVKSFEKKNYPAGTKLEFVITNPAYVTQYTIVTVNRNRAPSITTRCSQPGSKTRGAC